MSKYTTGELAKLCNVSVRTVQYYDTRGILMPSELSEGGRRLYSDDDLSKMKIICFLRELELPIDSIKNLFQEAHPEKVISILLDEQKKIFQGEMAEKQKRLSRIEETQRTLRLMAQISVESIGDIAHIMESKKQLGRVRRILLLSALPINVIEIATIVIWVKTGMWIPFAIGMCVVALLGAGLSAYYFGNVSYICPECHNIFKPEFKEAFWAKHTPYTRKLTCTHCGHRGFCVETYAKEVEKNE